MELKDKMKTLLNAYGVSGEEMGVSRIAAQMLEGLVDQVEIDTFGNVTGSRLSGVPGAKKLLLDAHLDQVGFLITGVTEQGFLRFTSIGVDPRMLVGSRLTVLSHSHGPMPGVVASLPPHIQTGEQNSATPISEMAIDVGLCAEEVKKRIQVGDYAAFAGDAFDMQGDTVCGKSMDDRACFTSLLYALELLKDKPLKVDLQVVGSVQEEVGCKGGLIRACAIRPDIAVAVDVTHAKTPDNKPGDRANTLGGGPVISIGAQSNPLLARRMLELARAKKIPHQVDAVPMSSGTNAHTMQTASEGTRTVVLSLPLRYMHTPVETLRMCDVKNLGALLKEFVLSFDGDKRGDELC